MIFSMRDAAGTWQALPNVVDYEDPTWATTLSQQRTPYGNTWVDGLNTPGMGRLRLTVYVSAITRAVCDQRTREALALLLTGTGFRDLRRSTDYLITQGVLGEPELKTYRGGVARHITVTLALADPYWHATDADGSTNLTPANAGTIIEPEYPGGGGTPQWGNLWT